MVIFNHAITRIVIHKKMKYWGFGSYRINTDFKIKVGTKFGIFPKYEKITCVTIMSGLFEDEFYSTIEDFKHDFLYIEDNVIYEKPNCTIVMNDGKSKDMYFDTDEELEQYVEKLKLIAPHIEV